jgi:nitrite reductase (NADH) small subunit
MTSTALAYAVGERGTEIPADHDSIKKSKTIVAMKTWVAVCKLTDIVPNTGVCALVGDQQVAVFRVDNDRLYAISNHDPFSRANVLSRGIVGDIKGELVVASPVYKQHFSLATGQCVEDSQVSVTVYPVRLDSDQVLVQG